ADFGAAQTPSRQAQQSARTLACYLMPTPSVAQLHDRRAVAAMARADAGDGNHRSRRYCCRRPSRCSDACRLAVPAPAGTVFFLPLIQVLLEPGDHVPAQVGDVSRLAEVVALALVDDQFGRRAERLQRMPVLERLRRRTLDVALADVDQRRRLRLLD